MTVLRISIDSRQRRIDVLPWSELMEKALTLCCARACKRDSQLQRLGLDLHFYGDAAMRKLNREQRGVSALTDVLSFPLHAFVRGEISERLRACDFYYDETGQSLLQLGDIVISPGRAQRQAEVYGHGMARELAFLAVHGCLHLLGYDHIEEDDEQLMRALQRETISELGL